MTSSAFNNAIDQIKAIPQKWQGHVLEFVRVLTGLPLDEAGFDQKVTVKGTYRDGTVELSDELSASINRRDGQSVIVTFLEDSDEGEDIDDSAWSKLDEILANCQVSTGIKDLAAQHDHYIHGTPKREV